MKGDLRSVSYKEHDTWQQGWCHLITNDPDNEIVMVVERADGTITLTPIQKVQFNDRITDKI